MPIIYGSGRYGSGPYGGGPGRAILDPADINEGSPLVDAGINGQDTGQPVPPEVAPSTSELYRQMGPHTVGDADAGWPLLSWLDGIGQLLQWLDQISGDQVLADGTIAPGWSQLLDVNRCPGFALPWLGQFVGVAVDTTQPVPAQRAQIVAEQGFGRGTRASIGNAIMATLTVGAVPDIRERSPTPSSQPLPHFTRDPYAYEIRTYRSQTPDPALTAAVAAATKPAGLLLTYTLIDGETYAATRNQVILVGQPDTYTGRQATFPTYNDASSFTG